MQRVSDDEALGEVESRLDDFFAKAIRESGRFGTAAPRLWAALREAADGGKRQRPRLLLAAFFGLGGTDLHAAAAVAAAYELLHTALLVHDDVIDRDWVRRGTPNVAGRYRDRAIATTSSRAAAHFGRSAAILAGDLALASAPRLVDSVEIDPSVRRRLHELLYEAVVASAAGEVADLELAAAELTSPPTTEQILTMEWAKTSVYSFEAPLMSGAVLAGASDDVIEALGRYGRELGLAYQIVDDLLGVFGDESVTGKSALGDLREGKWTVLIAHAARTTHWPALASILGTQDLTEAQAVQARDILARSGARDAAIDLAQRCTAEARRSLRHVPETLRARLDAHAEELALRTR